MRKYKLFVKEINDFADSIKNKEDIEFRVTEFIDSFDFMQRCHVFDNCLCVSDYPEYTICITISEKNGHVMAMVYDSDEYNKYNEALYEHWKRVETLPLEELLKLEDPDIKEKFSFEVPLTRGFSDTPERSDVDISSHCDMEAAVTEYLHERDNTQKIYPWMVRQLMPASELGITEGEYETLLQDALG